MKFIQPDWPVPASVKAYTTVRDSWGERQPYHDMHPGFYAGSENENQRLKTLLQLPSEPVWITQTHSNVAIAATPENSKKEADATFTDQPGQVCAILTADCLPVLVCNKQGSHVAAIHAGWRGLASGIIEATLKAMRQPAADLLVWLGPAIGPQKFEVGQDVYDAFVQKHPESAAAFLPQRPGKWLADLYTLARIRLRHQGVTQIYGGDFCTYTQADLFFSYRRDKGKTGRMASLIWRL
ncbi:peptidoglycan editing factor PgeF [Aquicella lusitana]|uniref:Purine nucleoside phosphorylase n=1 Tax=Aquicella lusitana TaxID=254246 RepID=A0A370H414_9COXI|nr:peptidoglycan editing factor PgeF [Aquicella lusitana]RDI48794.1 hypothetical protein C8D86_10173 [Aquicella lusitana]VVC73222.1 Laccase domain protein YfiH [Aquicella lusitana]